MVRYTKRKGPSRELPRNGAFIECAYAGAAQSYIGDGYDADDDDEEYECAGSEATATIGAGT